MIPFTTIPIISAFFLILIGVLIGHLVWYRFRDLPEDMLGDDDRDAERPESMQVEHKRLQQERDRLAKDVSESQAKITERVIELETIKASRSTLESQWHRLQSEHDQIKTEVTRLRHERDETNKTRDQEQQKIYQLERSLEQSKAELEKAQIKIDGLESKARQFADEVTRRDGNITGLSKEMGSFQERFDDAVQRLQAAERQRIELKSEVVELQTKLAESNASLKEERQLRSNLEKKCEDQVTEITRIESDLDRASRDLEKLAASDEEIVSMTQRVDALVRDRDAAKEDAKRKAAETERLRQEIVQRQSTHLSLRSQIEHLTTALQGEKSKSTKLYSSSLASPTMMQLQKDSDELVLLRQSHQQIQAALDETTKKYELKKQECETALSDLERARDLHRDLKMQVLRQEDLVQTLHQQNAELQTLRKSSDDHCAELEAEQADIDSQLKNHGNRLQALTTQRDAAMTKVSELETKVKEAASVAENLRHEKTENERELISVGQELSELRVMLNEERESRSSLELDLESKDLELSHLRQQVAEISAAAANAADSIAAESDSRAKLTAELETKTADVLSLREEIEKLKSVMAKAPAMEHRLAETAVDDAKLNELNESLKKAHRQIAELQKQQVHAEESERATKEIAAELRQELGDRLAAVEALERAREEAVEALQKEKQIRVEIEKHLNDRLSDTERELKGLKSKSQKADETVRQLRRERNERMARSGEKEASQPRQFITLSSFKNLESGSDGLDEFGKVRFDDDLGAVYKVAPIHVDDLKKISGIADVLEEKLNDLGIYKYQQIMQWDDVVVEEISKLLAFRDRIQRDNWIGQARRLYREHHGQRAA